ncbi:MAG: tetratricopeptide repeat protein [Desulfobacteraceae bacterium]|jgi:tetratricopeptide (TPR) repeat protein|nr:tetratricopeptide repeat protein [Desulfobacteraceae bacterium]
MPWFNLFSGPSAERLEQKGDALGAAGYWGAAKIEYERANRKLEAATIQDRGMLRRLEAKIVTAREALAVEHHRNASDLAAIGDFKEALELVELALTLTGDDALKATLAQQRREIEATHTAEGRQTLSEPEDEWNPEQDSADVQSPDEAFRALCGTLPNPVRRAYLGYGADFKTGYLALNNGDFETAATHLTRALEACNAADSYIPLELATACLQLNRLEQARQLLETLLHHHPDTLPAYQILCEIYWEQGAFDRADALLASIPSDLATSLAVFVLKGETLFQAGHFDMAKTFYRDFLATYGWDESIAGALARTHESLNEMDHARRMYQEIMVHCNSCHRRLDPLVKEKVADLSFAAGKHDTAVLELYLSLAQERPEKASVYYAKVGRIYQTTGNETEARRFQALADQIPRSVGHQSDPSAR